MLSIVVRHRGKPHPASPALPQRARRLSYDLYCIKMMAHGSMTGVGGGSTEYLALLSYFCAFVSSFCL